MLGPAIIHFQVIMMSQTAKNATLDVIYIPKFVFVYTLFAGSCKH